MSHLVAIFSPDEPTDTWTLRVVFDDAAFRLPGLDPGGRMTKLRRPDVDDLNTRMLHAHGGFVLRHRTGGAIEISATERSAVVLHDWLLSIIAETTSE